jgi:hypothetical protein
MNNLIILTMYRITNISLDKYLTQYKVKSLDALNDDQLVELCTSNPNINALPVYRKIAGNRGRGSFDRHNTIKAINNANSFSDYMGAEYWTTRHEEIAQGADLLNEVALNMNGENTLQAFSDIAFGFHKLAPGKSVEIDVTSEWVKVVLKKKPVAKLLKIEDLDAQPMTDEVLEEKLESNKATMLNNLDLNELRKLAKSKDLSGGGTRDEIIERLSKVV